MMNTMTTAIRTTEKTTALASVLFMAVLGGALLFAAGHAQSASLHDAAHDVRHATGFPCH
jgi:cobalt transporter subunit CbtB